MSASPTGYVDASDYGFLPDAPSVENTKALQAAVDRGGTVQVSRPGTYEMAATVFLGSHTTLEFGSGVFLKKDADVKPFSHVFLNKGALTRTWDENIVVRGLQIICNGVDVREWLVVGLHGHLAFFYVKDLRIERFRCLDIGVQQYCIHICTFRDIIIDDVVIKGDKDGIHLGRGRRFSIRNAMLETYDDAVALNAHDWWVGNPELGWIEDGVIENCHDLDDGKKPVGYFSRIIAGAWVDWYEGMEVQRGDTVVSNGRMYRVQSDPDGTVFWSRTQPIHETGTVTVDGIPWGMMQEDVEYTAGVRNVVFRDIFLHKPRVGMSLHLVANRWTRTYYPRAEIPVQQGFLLDNVRVRHDGPATMVDVISPVDTITITNSSFREAGLRVMGIQNLVDYGKTRITMIGCTFTKDGEMALVRDTTEGNRQIALKTLASTELSADFAANITTEDSSVTVDSDLTGLTAN